MTWQVSPAITQHCMTHDAGISVSANTVHWSKAGSFTCWVGSYTCFHFKLKELVWSVIQVIESIVFFKIFSKLCLTQRHPTVIIKGTGSTTKMLMLDVTHCAPHKHTYVVGDGWWRWRVLVHQGPSLSPLALAAGSRLVPASQEKKATNYEEVWSELCQISLDTTLVIFLSGTTGWYCAIGLVQPPSYVRFAR